DVLRQVHVRHAALPEQLEDPVGAEHDARRWRGGRRSVHERAPEAASQQCSSGSWCAPVSYLPGRRRSDETLPAGPDVVVARGTLDLKPFRRSALRGGPHPRAVAAQNVGCLALLFSDENPHALALARRELVTGDVERAR